MKKLIIILSILLLLPISTTFASDIRLSYKATFPNSDALSTTGGVEFEASHEGYLAWMSYEESMLRFVGQECVDISMFGMGLGYRLPIVKNLSVAIKGGYYKPFHNYRATYQEAIYRQMHAYVENAEGQNWRDNGIDYDIASAEYDIYGGFGGEIEVNWTVPLFDWLNLDLIAGWRYLNLKDRISANINGLGPEHDDLSETGSPYHEFLQYRNWNGGVLGVSLTWRF